MNLSIFQLVIFHNFSKQTEVQWLSKVMHTAYIAAILIWWTLLSQTVREI